MQNLRKPLVRDWKPVCSLVGVPSLGPRLPLSPPPCLWASPLPASPSLELLSPFVLRMAGSVFKPVNSLSLLLSHSLSCCLKAPSDCPQGIQPGLSITLSNAACSSPFRPHLLVADAGVWGTFLLGVAFRHIICGFHLFFLPVRLPSEIRKLPPDPRQREGFLVFGNFLYYDSLPWMGLRP